MNAPHRPELDEAVDLPMEHKTWLLDTFERLETITHYEVLGVTRDADKKAIKRAYFQLAGTLHPDRYRGKELGSFRERMLSVFSRATQAHDVLTSNEDRATYDAELGDAPAAPASVPAARVPVDPRIAAKRQAAMDALKQRFADGRSKAREFAEHAARAHAAGDVVAAAEAYERALAITPDDAALREAYASVKRAAAERLVESNTKKALLEERFGQWAQAAQTWQRVVEARPSDPTAREHLRNALERASGGAPSR